MCSGLFQVSIFYFQKKWFIIPDVFPFRPNLFFVVYIIFLFLLFFLFFLSFHPGCSVKQSFLQESAEAKCEFLTLLRCTIKYSSCKCYSNVVIIIRVPAFNYMIPISTDSILATIIPVLQLPQPTKKNVSTCRCNLRMHPVFHYYSNTVCIWTFQDSKSGSCNMAHTVPGHFSMASIVPGPGSFQQVYILIQVLFMKTAIEVGNMAKLSRK